jgi:hypothetical protein
MNTLKTTTNLRLFALGIVMLSFLISSCTSLQQTTTIATDDLYYAPNKKVDETQAVAANEEDGYQDYQNYQDDRYLRMKVANRNRWSVIDDWGYWNDPRFNFGYYPSYMGWNSWYTGYYGASWFSPFGPSFALGWGGYYPYSSFGYGLGWGGFYDDFAFGYGGYGFGYGLGYGYGWNPYYMGYWNPYGYYYGMGGIYGGGVNVRNYDKRVPMQNRTSLDPYINNANRLKGRGDIQNNNAAFVGSNSNGRSVFSSYLPNTNMGARSMNSNSYNSNSNNSNGLSARSMNSNSYNSNSSNSNGLSARSNVSSNSFGSLVMRAITSSANARSSNSNSYNSNSGNSSRYNSSSNSSYNNSSSNRSSSAPAVSVPSSSGSSSSGSSSGGGFIGGGRRGGGGQ